MDPATIASLMYGQPARPVTPTPNPTDLLYGPGGVDPQGGGLGGALNNLGGSMPSAMLTPETPMAPLPSWIPQNVQDYMRFAPSYEESQRQALTAPNIAGGEPYSPTPQINDLRRLFGDRMRQNSPTSGGGFTSKQLSDLMKMRGFAGFSGGDRI